MRRSPHVHAVLLTALTCLPPSARAAQADGAAFARIVETAADRELTPGLAVAVVEGDRVVWTGVAGTADLDTGRPVTESTRFYIASTSKALTGLAAAIAADRGQFSLTDPLARALPRARLSEGLSADSIRVIDLLAHTHGIDMRGPVSLRIAFSGEYADNAELLGLLANHPPARDGRAFRYSNLGYDLVGMLLAPEGRDGWKEVVERDVCAPLGMTHTTAWRSRIAEEALAMPHEMGPRRFTRIRLAKEDANMGAAGGHFATAGDLGRLVVAELNRGRIDGREVVPARVIEETQRLHAVQDRTFSAYKRHGWGIGWDLGTFEADTLVHRFGGFGGYFCHVSFMPGHRAGVVVLVNGGAASTAVGNAVANAIYDRLLQRPDAEARWNASLEDCAARVDEARAEIAADVAERAGRPHAFPMPLEAYVGEYRDEQFGTLRLERSRDGLAIVFGAARSDVEPYDPAENQLRVELLGSGGVITAVAGPDGRVESLEMLGRSFTRR